MSDAVKIALIGGAVALVSLILNGFIAMKQANAAQHLKETKEAVDLVTHQVDGKLSKMLDLMEENSWRKGALDERERTEKRADAMAVKEPTP